MDIGIPRLERAFRFHQTRAGNGEARAGESSCIRALVQAARRRIHWLAYRLARYEKFDSPVLLATGRVVVGGHGRAIAEAFCGNRVRRYALLYQVITH